MGCVVDESCFLSLWVIVCHMSDATQNPAFSHYEWLFAICPMPRRILLSLIMSDCLPYVRCHAESCFLSLWVIVCHMSDAMQNPAFSHYEWLFAICPMPCRILLSLIMSDCLPYVRCHAESCFLSLWVIVCHMSDATQNPAFSHYEWLFAICPMPRRILLSLIMSDCLPYVRCHIQPEMCRVVISSLPSSQ